PGDVVPKRLAAGKLAVRDRLVDLQEILQHDPAGAQGHVADPGIADLAPGQAHILLASAEAGAGAGPPQPAAIRGPRLDHGVVGGILAPAPAVQHAKDNGARGRLLVGHVAGYPLRSVPVYRRSGGLEVAAPSGTAHVAEGQAR